MAIQKSITDDRGVLHAEAYAKITTLVMEHNGVFIKIAVYHNADTRSKSDKTNMKMPILESSTVIKGSAYTTYFNESVLKEENKSPLTQAYAWLKTVEEFGIDWTTGTTDV